jgi:hypothetical protein
MLEFVYHSYWFWETHLDFISQKDYTLYTAGENYLTPSEKPTTTTFSKGRGGRWERVTFKVVISYHGGSFDGWQKQPGLNTVQG